MAFVKCPEMLERQYGLAVAADETAIYAVGGVGSKSAEMFSFQEKQWKPLPDMSQVRIAASMAIWEKRLYVFGGYRVKFPHVGQSSSCVCFDFTTG
mmetsp:Transcript_29520/g.68288  ORF Transcript_29520/g.68288 Transcript_29520/m.68288 type:complete len:96 (-) Transcript_29520:177-464(-)